MRCSSAALGARCGGRPARAHRDTTCASILWNTGLLHCQARWPVPGCGSAGGTNVGARAIVAAPGLGLVGRREAGVAMSWKVP